MKILALSDIHGDSHLCQEMATKAKNENIDLVVLAGDLANEEGFIEGIVGPFKKKGLEVAVIPGNHEGMSEINFLVEKYGVFNLHEGVLKKDDVGIFGCGYGNVGLCQISSENLFNILKEGNKRISNVKKKIMVTHTHPEYSVFGLGMFPGCLGVTKAIYKFNPDVHICGHVHETEGMEQNFGKTKSINVGRIGKIIDI